MTATAQTAKAATTTQDHKPSAAGPLWERLNERQQLYLRTIYEADQAREAEVHAARAAGDWQDNRKAAEWRQLDAYREPKTSRLTALQKTWKELGHHNQGNGSTIAVLAEAKVITLGSYPTGRGGVMHTVAMTTLGRRVVRAATGQGAQRRPKGLNFSERSVEVLGLLYTAHLSPSGGLDWGYSSTISTHLNERAKKHLGQPLAERDHRRLVYRLTEFGVAYYCQNFRALQDAYPELVLPAPAGLKVEPWPEQADRLLAGLRSGYRGLIGYVAQCRQELAATAPAETVPDAAPAAPAPAAPAVDTLLSRLQAEERTLLAGQAREREDLLASQARARTEQRTGHRRIRTEQLTEHIAAAEAGIDAALVLYIHGVLAAAQALVDGGDVCAAITAELPRTRNLAEPVPLPTTGIANVDLEARRLWDAWATKARAPKSRGQVNKPRPVTGIVGLDLPADLIGTAVEAPFALAQHLHAAMHGGTLHRQLQGLAAGTGSPAQPTESERRP